jgi:hypothetical protein
MTLRRVFLAYAAAVSAGLFLFVGAAGAAEEPEPGAGKAPAADPAKPAAEQAANGLQISVSVKERSYTFGDNTVTRKVAVLELKNVGDKPLVLAFQLSGGGFGGLPADSPVKLSGKDAAGKEVPRETGRGGRDGQTKPEDKPVILTVLKPGKTLEQDLGGGLRFPADGKYSVWAELEEKERDEILPGVKTWVGKVKSNVLEYDYKGRGGRGNRPGGAGNRGGGAAGVAGGQNPAPPAGDKEAF